MDHFDKGGDLIVLTCANIASRHFDSQHCEPGPLSFELIVLSTQVSKTLAVELLIRIGYSGCQRNRPSPYLWLTSPSVLTIFTSCLALDKLFGSQVEILLTLTACCQLANLREPSYPAIETLGLHRFQTVTVVGFDYISNSVHFPESAYKWGCANASGRF